MATIFGMTYFGDPKTLLHAQRRPLSGSIKDVPRKRFLEVFLKKGHENLNEDSIRRAILPQVFTDAIGRQLTPSEIDLVLRYFPCQPGNISYEMFAENLKHLQADTVVSPPPVVTKVAKTLVGNPLPRKKILNSEIAEMKGKHRRDPLGPAETLVRPLTTNMEYGWDTMVFPGESATPLHERKSYHPKGQTDVTVGGEGLTLETYYGVEYIRI